MEWMLQVVDEIDDALGAVRLAASGLAAEAGMAAAGVIGIGAIGAGIAAQAEVSMLSAAAILLSLAAGLQVQGLRTPHTGP